MILSTLAPPVYSSINPSPQHLLLQKQEVQGLETHKNVPHQDCWLVFEAIIITLLSLTGYRTDGNCPGQTEAKFVLLDHSGVSVVFGLNACVLHVHGENLCVHYCLNFALRTFSNRFNYHKRLGVLLVHAR